MLVEDSVLDVRDGRHPVLDQILPAGTFVPNDAAFGPDAGTFWLVTGPNMAGKSTFLRQVISSRCSRNSEASFRRSLLLLVSPTGFSRASARATS